MRFGAVLPIPGDASPHEVVEFARAAEDLGLDSVWMNVRVVRPLAMSSRHPYTPDGAPPWPPTINWPDAFVVFASIAAVTTRLRLVPGVVPLIQTHPLLLAKQAATLDAYSGGRLELGLGAGWLLEEAAALGHPVDHRWGRVEEAIDILRLAWSRPTFSYEGRFWRLPEVSLHPHPPQGERLPLWIGAKGERGIRVAARKRAGLFLWGGVSAAEVAAYATRLRAIAPTAPLAVLLSLTAGPDRRREALDDLRAAGADVVVVGGRFPTVAARLDAIGRFASDSRTAARSS
jgi:probable F420-dependent oxidoreductase